MFISAILTTCKDDKERFEIITTFFLPCQAYIGTYVGLLNLLTESTYKFELLRLYGRAWRQYDEEPQLALKLLSSALSPAEVKQIPKDINDKFAQLQKQHTASCTYKGRFFTLVNEHKVAAVISSFFIFMCLAALLQRLNNAQEQDSNLEQGFK